MRVIHSDEHVITDINLASTLLVSGFELNRKCERIKSKDSEALYFYFKKTDKLLNAIELYNTPTNESKNFYQLCGELFSIRKELIDNLDKCSTIIELKKNNKVLMLSEDLPQKEKESLLKRF